ncbi:hypothetical protein [Aeromicrobium sp.]|uniref:hypothetical protein n=1 Tax=Aeromicrobium sp. TaxID=1871063 RepID=UPI00199D020A|nr:hypothetical protein [Aeromicrobium sp.]MBC7631032.1 hypothetical protein [Aeromicrobium sp.]
MITSQDFFALVERHLTAAMLEAHYVKIGQYDVMRSSPTSELLSSGHAGPRRSRVSSWLQKHRGAPKVAALEVGYEGSSNGDEDWILYYPETRELDLTSWRDTLDGHADWDVWHDRLVQDKAELERRLVVLSAAIRGQSE